MPSRKIIARGLAALGLFAALTIGPASAQTSQPSDSDSGPALINLAPTNIPDQTSPDQPQDQADAAPPATADITTGDGTDDQADQPPPDLVDYDQPFAPGALYIWCPGYWADHPGRKPWVRTATNPEG